MIKTKRTRVYFKCWICQINCFFIFLIFYYPHYEMEYIFKYAYDIYFFYTIYYIKCSLIHIFKYINFFYSRLYDIIYKHIVFYKKRLFSINYLRIRTIYLTFCLSQKF